MSVKCRLKANTGEPKPIDRSHTTMSPAVPAPTTKTPSHRSGRFELEAISSACVKRPSLDDTAPPFAASAILVAQAGQTAIGARRAGDGGSRIRGELGQQMADRRVELRVLAREHLRRIVDHLDVGRHAEAFDAPRAVELVEREGGNRRLGAVDQSGVAADADEAAPGARADELAEPVLAEVVGEAVTARAGG